MPRSSNFPSKSDARYGLGFRLANRLAKQLGYQNLSDIIGGAASSATLEINLQHGTLTLKHLDGHFERVPPRV